MILMEGKVLDTKHSVYRNAFNTLIIQICSTKQESVKNKWHNYSCFYTRTCEVS